MRGLIDPPLIILLNDSRMRALFASGARRLSRQRTRFASAAGQKQLKLNEKMTGLWLRFIRVAVSEKLIGS